MAGLLVNGLEEKKCISHCKEADQTIGNQLPTRRPDRGSVCLDQPRQLCDQRLLALFHSFLVTNEFLLFFVSNLSLGLLRGRGKISQDLVQSPQPFEDEHWPLRLLEAVQRGLVDPEPLLLLHYCFAFGQFLSQNPIYLSITEHSSGVVKSQTVPTEHKTLTRMIC